MKNILIYKSPNLNITYFVDNLNINQVHEKAQNMLDFGTPYRICTIDELPVDCTFRDAWDIDDTDLNDGISGEEKTKQNLSQLIAKVEQEKENLKQTKEKIDDAKSKLDTLSGELPELENKAFESKKSEIKGVNSTIEMLESNISVIQSSIENGNSAISICKNKLNELLEKLPLEKRRGYIEPVSNNLK